MNYSCLNELLVSSLSHSDNKAGVFLTSIQKVQACLHWVPLRMSSFTTSTTTMSSFFLRKEHFSLTSMFKKFGYNEYLLQ